MIRGGQGGYYPLYWNTEGLIIKSNNQMFQNYQITSK